jgi:hypothetical protein
MLFGALVVAVMLFAFAPSIPGLRRLVPAKRRISRLESLWVEGDALSHEAVTSDHELASWQARRTQWHKRTVEWIDSNISSVEALRFHRPQVMAFDIQDHSRGRNQIHHQLSELLRLRDAERESLR